MYFAYPIDFILPYQFWKKMGIYQVWFLFGVIPDVVFLHSKIKEAKSSVD